MTIITIYSEVRRALACPCALSVALCFGAPIAKAGSDAQKAPTLGVVDVPGLGLISAFSVQAIIARANGNVDKLPVPNVMPLPAYPVDALKIGVIGETTLTFTISQEGTCVEVSADNATRQEFAEASISAVKQWRFTPPTLEGRPVSVKARVRFIFSQFDVMK